MTDVWVIVVGGILSILAATISHYFIKRRELDIRDAEHKLERYNYLLESFAGIGSGYKTYEAHVHFTNAVNTLNLIASKKVLEAVYELVDYIQTPKGESYNISDQDRITNKLILEIRRDLHSKTLKDFKQFEFRIKSHGLKPGEVVDTLEG
ncbi:MAG: hypothetical protein LAKADJCE_00081 [Candidatus Argoarchaeum ethanivorans]|uniref:Uncharacterized protein n=1 Tax=Candidatus Argoarchaeum ethanivorans TaxID=2608793 RepID=A0A811T9F9_9EURY|nr:MAG: hypothetical protein LAKADJCE_00081 [Candidatus Argoarchaeum ethanivorans]